MKLLAKPNPSRCRSCGSPVIWITTPAGKMTPLDVVESYRGKGWLATAEGWRLVDGTPENPVHAAHFATCPQGQQWRQGTKGGGR